MQLKNLFADIPARLDAELVEQLVYAPGARIERIVSHGQRSPDGFWYDQPEDEWVILLHGNAGLRFEGDAEVVALQAGDYVNIPAHTRHRVEWTAANQKTVWLAVHYPPASAPIVD